MASQSIETLKARAQMLKSIRDYFSEHSVLEVETPLLCASTAMDPHLESFVVPTAVGDRFLQTSPEFPMKRLLAAGSGSIYQICKAFRVDESGSRHNPEFSMLEWYRVGWASEQLQREVVDLVVRVAALFGQEWRLGKSCTYSELFQSILNIDPFTASEAELADCAKHHLGEVPELDRMGWLDLLMSLVIEPVMPKGLTLVTDFPAEQAALAQKAKNEQGHWVAKRFELYVNGVELANGYQELVDPNEQRERFEEDNTQRKQLGLRELPMPEPLLAAMESGIPDCAGVALGLDRLLMLALGKPNLAYVVSFDFPNA